MDLRDGIWNHDRCPMPSGAPSHAIPQHSNAVLDATVVPTIASRHPVPTDHAVTDGAPPVGNRSFQTLLHTSFPRCATAARPPPTSASAPRSGTGARPDPVCSPVVVCGLDVDSCGRHCPSLPPPSLFRPHQPQRCHRNPPRVLPCRLSCEHFAHDIPGGHRFRSPLFRTPFAAPLAVVPTNISTANSRRRGT